MISKKSRYANPSKFSREDNASAVFKGIRPRVITPAAGVLEYTVKAGDRLDLLSMNFYNNTQHWWRILDANPELIFGADLMLASYVGETILIPRAPEMGGAR